MLKYQTSLRNGIIRVHGCCGVYAVAGTAGDGTQIQPMNMPQESLFNYLESLLKIDLFIKSLQNKFEYMRIDYSQINVGFHKIAKYIGSSASESFIFNVTSNPPTKKRQSSIHKVTKNPEEYDLIDLYENIKNNILLGSS